MILNFTDIKPQQISTKVKNWPARPRDLDQLTATVKKLLKFVELVPVVYQRKHDIWRVPQKQKVLFTSSSSLVDFEQYALVFQTLTLNI